MYCFPGTSANRLGWFVCVWLARSARSDSRTPQLNKMFVWCKETKVRCWVSGAPLISPTKSNHRRRASQRCAPHHQSFFTQNSRILYNCSSPNSPTNLTHKVSCYAVTFPSSTSAQTADRPRPSRTQRARAVLGERYLTIGALLSVLDFASLHCTFFQERCQSPFPIMAIFVRLSSECRNA